jgi:hypothetical protein
MMHVRVLGARRCLWPAVALLLLPGASVLIRFFRVKVIFPRKNDDASVKKLANVFLKSAENIRVSK